MRLLKARGKLSHADLVALLPPSLPRECLNTGTTTGSHGTGSDVHVSLEPELLSKCVEYLLDKEYIELENLPRGEGAYPTQQQSSPQQQEGLEGGDVVYVYVP